MSVEFIADQLDWSSHEDDVLLHVPVKLNVIVSVSEWGSANKEWSLDQIYTDLKEQIHQAVSDIEGVVASTYDEH